MAASRLAELELDRSIGFAGGVRGGLVMHPDGRSIVYPLGSSVVVRTLGVAGSQEFLQGHSAAVSCLAVSPCGRFLASGQRRVLTTKADICVWDFATRALVHRLVLHKADIRELAFSPSATYLVSLGGDDDNAIVLWDLRAGTAICGSPASMGSSGVTNCVRYFNGSERHFVTGGAQTLRMWTYDPKTRKLSTEECRLGHLKRIVTALAVDPADELVYAGTSTGDVLAINVATRLFQFAGPKKPLAMGVTALALAAVGVLVGSGEGKLALLERPSLRVIGLTELAGSIESVALDGTGRCAFVGTAEANIYYVDLATFEAELRSSGHVGAVRDVAFPLGFSEVFATAGMGDIRVWNSRRSLELVRIAVPNVGCLCLAFTADGGAIVSGWADGRIRAFGPETGTQLFAIPSAHTDAVTAIACAADGKRVISGGSDGQVRVWRLLAHSQTMDCALKEHRAPVVSVHMRANDREAITGSTDGSCIVWDLVRKVRLQVLFAPTLFTQAAWHPHEAHALTVGTDRKIAYWDTIDGTVIRELETESASHANSIALFADGERFVTGGNDRRVSFWAYDEGVVLAESRELTGNVIKLAVSPDQQEVVAVTDDGGVFVLAVPAGAGLAATDNRAEYF